MGYETLIENLVFWSKAFHVNPKARYALEKATTAITDLLIENQALRNAANGFKERAEAAEARCKMLEKWYGSIRTSLCRGIGNGLRRRRGKRKKRRKKLFFVETDGKRRRGKRARRWKLFSNGPAVLSASIGIVLQIGAKSMADMQL